MRKGEYRSLSGIKNIELYTQTKHQLHRYRCSTSEPR